MFPSQMSRLRALRSVLGSKPVVVTLLVIEALAALVFYLIPPIREYRSFSLWNFDYGILFQSSASFAHGKAPLLTTRGVHALADNQEYFQIAFAWAHHLPGPHYWMLLLHSLGIFSSGIVAFALSRRHGAIALLMPAFVWLSPFLININLDLFHTEAFATILILLMYAGARAGKLVLYLVSLSLALLCKEDVAITVATFSVLAWLKSDWFALPRRVFQWSALAAVAVFSTNLLVVLPHYKLQTCLWLDPGFNVAGLDAAPVAPFFRNTFASLFRWDFYRERLGRVLVLLYLLKLMWPVLLVASKVGPFWLLPLPGAAINVVADADYLVTGYFHYDHSTFAGVIIVVLLGLERVRHKAVIAALLVATSLLLPMFLPQWYRARPGQLFEQHFWRIPRDERVTFVEQLNERLPPDVVISADYNSVSYLLPGREKVFMFENPFQLQYFGIYGLCEKMAAPPMPEVLVLRAGYEVSQLARGIMRESFEKLGGRKDIDVFVNRKSPRYAELARIVRSN